MGASEGLDTLVLERKRAGRAGRLLPTHRELPSASPGGITGADLIKPCRDAGSQVRRADGDALTSAVSPRGRRRSATLVRLDEGNEVSGPVPSCSRTGRSTAGCRSRDWPTTRESASSMQRAPPEARRCGGKPRVAVVGGGKLCRSGGRSGSRERGRPGDAATSNAPI